MMVSLTNNEARVIDFLIRNFTNKCNINQLSRELSLSPRGTFKILKKLESLNYLVSSKEGNNVFYSINYDLENTLDLCKFVLAGDKPSAYVRVQINEIKKLKELVTSAILFGSVLTKENKANDIDVILVFDEKNFSKIEKTLADMNILSVKKFHAIYQTEKDFMNNIRKQDKVILSGIKTGIVLWGKGLFLESIKNGQNR
jgi:predicted nucleotidyltransferase